MSTVLAGLSPMFGIIETKSESLLAHSKQVKANLWKFGVQTHFKFLGNVSEVQFTNAVAGHA